MRGKKNQNTLQEDEMEDGEMNQDGEDPSQTDHWLSVHGKLKITKEMVDLWNRASQLGLSNAKKLDENAAELAKLYENLNLYASKADMDKAQEDIKKHSADIEWIKYKLKKVDFTITNLCAPLSLVKTLEDLFHKTVAELGE